jgi:hypothetical protein
MKIAVNRATAIISAFAIAGVLAIGVIALGSRATHEFIGQWKSWRSDLRISRDGENYKIIVDNPKGLLGGTYRGKLSGTVIDVSGPLASLCGAIAYSKDADKLEFCGEEFTLVRATVP